MGQGCNTYFEGSDHPRIALVYDRHIEAMAEVDRVSHFYDMRD